MTRPSVLHQGFFVPNAKDVAKPELAEPDRIDFNTVAHARWGVINGCLVTVATATATVTAGTALVDGKLVTVAAGQNVAVGAGGTQDRFDIVGVNEMGTLVAVPGTESLDPVFPDVPLKVTALAAVLCTAGGGNYTDNVIDKRKFLADSLLTKIPESQDLIVNRNGSGNVFKIDGGGITSWSGDTIIQRHSAGTLRITTHLRVDDTIIAGGGIQAKSLVATERIIGSNLRNGNTTPSDASGAPGDMFQHNGDGTLWIHQGGKWEQIATVKSSVPMGSIITSLQRPASMAPGWVPLNGSAQVQENTQPELFALLDSWNWPRSGTAPNRVITTLNATKRMLMVDFDGNAGSLGGSAAIEIGPANIPSHVHNVRTNPGGAFTPSVTLGRAGGHQHSISGGEHGHNIVDPGHAHYGADRGDGGGFITTAWGGSNKIDAFFNDRSHTYSVEMALWTRAAATGISVGASGSSHGHEITSNGDHDHTVTPGAVPSHTHVIVEDPIGISAPLPFTPSYLSVYCYIRS